MTDRTLNITAFPSELLIIIFEYCSAFDLVKLTQVCKRFHEIIEKDLIWLKKSHLPLVTNQKSGRFLERCNRVLCNRSKWRISYNWQYGKYTKKLLHQQYIKVIPKLRMRSHELWWCGNNLLYGFKRTIPFSIDNVIFKCVNSICDFSTFVLMRDCVITGDSVGALRYWSYDECKRIHVTSAHADDIITMDATSEVILTSSADKTIKVFPAPVKDDELKCYDYYYFSIPITDKVWSIKADVKGTKFAVGTSANTIKPLHIYDIEQCVCLMQLNHNWRYGAGILDMVWENPHTLLTCGYDTFIRKWDLRCGKCVNSWADPTDATLYCISSDYNHTMITGTQFNCMAVLWDQRQREYMQLYFMKCPGNYDKSPIYSLDFDNINLYSATDRYLVELNFYENTKQSLNYNGVIK
ncbi:F-box/WD repeat-containing protein 4 [Harpegnathos saltator]|uniref:F-box/WD repeat-containing protein 4 n=2 Tax=Harpegnathos saltator TaxID=610380 RepID=E2C1K0_HARSA|nr:F-box/WD repeat-containing protein 4 [Harpegnathos saltator]